MSGYTPSVFGSLIMAARGDASVTLARAPEQYGSGCPNNRVPHAGVFPVPFLLVFAWCGALTMSSDAVAKIGPAAVLPLVEGERPAAAKMKDWLERSIELFPPAERALIEGRTPPGTALCGRTRR